MSRRDQLRDLSSQLRTPADQPAPKDPPQTRPHTAPNPPPHRPKPATNPPQRPTSTRPPTASATVKTNLSLPVGTAQRLREWAESNGRSLADGIVTALIDAGDALEQQHGAEARRVSLGLPALASADAGERTTVSIRIPAPALAELDSTASRLGLTRSGLATAVLDLPPRPAAG